MHNLYFLSDWFDPRNQKCVFLFEKSKLVQFWICKWPLFQNFILYSGRQYSESDDTCVWLYRNWPANKGKHVNFFKLTMTLHKSNERSSGRIIIIINELFLVMSLYTRWRPVFDVYRPISKCDFQNDRLQFFSIYKVSKQQYASRVHGTVTSNLI